MNIALVNLGGFETIYKCQRSLFLNGNFFLLNFDYVDWCFPEAILGFL